MTCQYLESMGEDGKRFTMIAKTARVRRSRCPVCGDLAEPRLCDGLDPGAKKTCDAKVCASCSTKGTRPRPPLRKGEVRSAGPEHLDFCARHRHQASNPPAPPAADTSPDQASLDLGPRK